MRSEAEEKLFKQIEKIRGADADAMRDAAAYVQSLAAPPGSLGKLTDAAVQLAGITGRVKNTLDRRRIIVMCADNGVVAEGVSSTPPIVTLSQALNMTRHLTGMSSLARHFGCEVEVVDIGIATPYQGKDSGILQCRIRRGTGNIANEPAMSREEAVAAILVGIERARQASKDGVDVIGVGEMGIGNKKEIKGLNPNAFIILQSIDGIGPVFAGGIIAEIGDISAFHSSDALAKYAGLMWKSNQSGDFNGEDTPMMKAGNRYLRYYLGEAANSMRKHNVEYGAYYRKKYNEVPKHQHKRALALTSRKFVRLVYGLLAKNQLYSGISLDTSIKETI